MTAPRLARAFGAVAVVASILSPVSTGVAAADVQAADRTTWVAATIREAASSLMSAPPTSQPDESPTTTSVAPPDETTPESSTTVPTDADPPPPTTTPDSTPTTTAPEQGAPTGTTTPDSTPTTTAPEQGASTTTTSTSSTTPTLPSTTAAASDPAVATRDQQQPAAETVPGTVPPDPSPDDTPVAPPLPPEPTAPLPPVNVDWMATTGGHRPRAAHPGPASPYSGRVPGVARQTAFELDVILATIREVESGNRFEFGPDRAGASGAYRYLPSTWAGHAGYGEAHLAPAEVQDAKARADVEQILATYHGDPAMIPVIWYFPLAARDPSWMDRVPDPTDGNTLTVREYQTRWLDTYTTTRDELAVDLADPAPVTVLEARPSAQDRPPQQDDGDDPSPADVLGDHVFELAARSTPPDDLPPHGEGAMRSIAFPVLGPATYADGWNDCRDGCARRHEGTDIMGVPMQPLLAAVDGTITRIGHESAGTAGVVITLTDAEGWRYNYFHLNDDTPGTDDDRAEPAWRIAPHLEVGDQVVAGQIIGYMGDSGNAKSVPHLHFEFRDPTGRARPSYWSLKAAEARQACTIGLGPWSFPHAPNDEPGSAVMTTAVRPMFGDGSWLVDTDGRVTATGDAALIIPSTNLACTPGPTSPFGSDASGWTLNLDITSARSTAAATTTTRSGVDVVNLADVDAVWLADFGTFATPGQRTADADGARPSISSGSAFRHAATGEVFLVAAQPDPAATSAPEPGVGGDGEERGIGGDRLPGVPGDRVSVGVRRSHS